MKQLFIAAALLLSGIAAYADDLPYMIVETADGASVNYTISKVEKLTFNPSEGLVANDHATVSRIYFSATEIISTAINGEPASISVSAFPNPVCGTLHIKGAPADAQYSIFDLSGRTCLTGEGCSIDVVGLPNGTYLLKVDDATLKFIKK